MQRRALLRLGLASSALMGIGGVLVADMRSGWRGGQLSEDGRNVFAAVSRAVVHPLAQADQHTMAVQLRAVEAVIASLPGPVQGELDSLLAVLSTLPGRRLLAGLAPDWRDASVAETTQALGSMRRSRVTLRVQAYLALRELSLAAHHAETASWKELGYPGPVPIG